jgi:hypothetical protein
MSGGFVVGGGGLFCFGFKSGSHYVAQAGFELVIILSHLLSADLRFDS